jgi:hypothetical protein
MKKIELFNFKPEDKILHILFYIVILIGISLSLYQFFFNRSLWIDEAALALNIINRDFGGLLNPLDYKQVAPIGFLYIEKLMTIIVGKNEFALRLFPLFSHFASIILLYIVTMRLSKNRTISLLAVALFSIDFILIRYATEVKQYSSDVLISLIIVYSTISLSFRDRRSIVIYSLVGAISIWFSNASIVILAVSALYISYTNIYRDREYKIGVAFVIWGLSFIIYYYLFILDHPSSQFMKSYWKAAFLPTDPLSHNFYHFLYIKIESILRYILRISGYWVIPWSITILGIVLLVKSRKIKIVYFAIMPIVIHLFLSSQKLYPFETRLLLYTSPLLIIFYAKTLYYIYYHLLKKIKIPIYVLLIPLIIMIYNIYNKKNFGGEIEDIKHGISYIDRNSGRDEDIYIYNMAQDAFKFYIDSKQFMLKNNIIFGSIHRNHNEMYDRELLALSGKPWLLFSHVYRAEERYMINLLRSRGAKILESHHYAGGGLYHMDTTNMDRELYYPYLVNGFYGWDRGVIGGFGWSDSNLTMVLPNYRDRATTYRLDFKLQVIGDRDISILVDDREIRSMHLKSFQKKDMNLSIRLNSKESYMKILTDRDGYQLNKKDPRIFTFSISNMRYRAIDDTNQTK